MWLCQKCSRVAVASSTPLDAWYANCIGSTRCCVWEMLCLWTGRSKHCITSKVKAIGWKSYGSLGLGIFGTGTIVALFHIVGTFCILIEDLKMSVNTGASCSAHHFRTAPPILPGPGLFPLLQPLNSLRTLTPQCSCRGRGGAKPQLQPQHCCCFQNGRKRSWVDLPSPFLHWH